MTANSITKILPLRRIKEANPCDEAYADIAAQWPYGVPLIESTVDKAIEIGVDFDWTAEHLLPASALAEYRRVGDSAFAEYDRVMAPALAEYQRVRAPALAEYERARLLASADVMAKAFAEYALVSEPALVEYHRVRAPALAEYKRVKANTLLRLLVDTL